MKPRALSLFSGGGGGDVGLNRAGLAVVAHCEIEPHARAVLREQFPDVPLRGDVVQLNGADFAGVDLVVGGSPCQDLSVAGKRAGLDGARSGLFYEQLRVWLESGAPNLLWENVCGALSSNEGRDFACILGAIVGAPVPVPADGWGGAGVVAGPTGVAAWRVVDLQHFGPPQRRRRVFVCGARAGGVDPAEVLLEPESLRGDSAPRRRPREAAAEGAGRGAALSFQEPGKRTGVSTTDPRAGSGIGEAGDPCYTLQAGAQHGVLAFDWQNSPSQGMAVRSESDDSLRTNAVPAVLSFQNTGQGWWNQSPVAATLRTPDGSGSLEANVVCVAGDRYSCGGCGHRGDETAHRETCPVCGDEDYENVMIRPTIGPDAGRVFDFDRDPQGYVDPEPAVCITGERTHALTSEGADASEDGTGRGTPIIYQDSQYGVAAYSTAGALRAGRIPEHQMVIEGGEATPIVALDAQNSLASADVFPTLDTGAAKGNRGPQVLAGIPRRLTPRECERLMGWPDDYTRYGVAENGRRYELSDSARYRICGNGIGAPHTHWIGLRFLAAWQRLHLSQERAA